MDVVVVCCVGWLLCVFCLASLLIIVVVQIRPFRLLGVRLDQHVLKNSCVSV